MSTITIVMLLVYLVAFGGGGVFMICKSMKGRQTETIEGKADGFGSRIGFVISTIGMSVGVGAMWRFPMMCAKWGGGAFVLAFVVICILIVIPAGFAEIAMGRKLRDSNVSALGSVAGKPGKVLAWVCSLEQAVQFGYFPAIIALVVIYFFKSFKGMDYAADAEGLFESVNGNRPLVYGIIVLLLIGVGLISMKGVKNGIEKICKIMLPGLFIILVILAVRVCFIPGIAEGIEFYIKPDWSQLKNSEMWAQAAGMALFAVGLGPGILLAYGRYTDDSMDIATDFVTVNVVQLFICLLSGFIIIPAVKVFEMDPLMGKGVMFVALPKVFATMSGGAIFMALFFLAVFFAGVSSHIAQLEVGIQAFEDKQGMKLSRTKAIIVVVVIAAIAAIPCTWSDTLFALIDNVCGNILYTVTALGIAIVGAWVVGAKKIREEWYNNTSAIKWGAWIDVLYKYLVVIVLGYFSITAVISLFQ
ncbi:MAG: sodium-dependent transporter [Emergencia sp.]